MLVLTRKRQESIRIGQDIKITILSVKGNTVRVGVDAPRAIKVIREELPRFDSEDDHQASNPLESSGEEMDRTIRRLAVAETRIVEQRRRQIPALVESSKTNPKASQNRLNGHSSPLSNYIVSASRAKIKLPR